MNRQTEDEYIPGYSTEDWDMTVWSSGYVRLQTMTKYEDGQFRLESGDVDGAALSFARTKELAEGCGATDLVLKAVTAAAIVRAMQGEKEVATSDLNMIKVRIERMNNPLIVTQYKAALQRIASL